MRNFFFFFYKCTQQKNTRTFSSALGLKLFAILNLKMGNFMPKIFFLYPKLKSRGGYAGGEVFFFSSLYSCFFFLGFYFCSGKKKCRESSRLSLEEKMWLLSIWYCTCNALNWFHSFFVIVVNLCNAISFFFKSLMRPSLWVWGSFFLRGRVRKKIFFFFYRRSHFFCSGKPPPQNTHTRSLPHEHNHTNTLPTHRS